MAGRLPGGRWVRVACVALVVGGGVALAAEEMVVRRPRLDVQSTKGGFGPVVAVVRENDKLTVLGREGDWLKVRTADGKQGFVKAGALTSKAISASGSALAGGAGASGLNASLASKGALPEANYYATQNNYQTAGVDRMVSIHESISPADFEVFQREGKVGEYKGK